jgi:hypothetical protein
LVAMYEKASSVSWRRSVEFSFWMVISRYLKLEGYNSKSYLSLFKGSVPANNVPTRFNNSKIRFPKMKEEYISPGINGWKLSSIWMSSMLGSHRWFFYSTKKWRAKILSRGLEFDKFSPWLKSGIFKCRSWLNGFLLGDEGGFLWQGI